MDEVRLGSRTLQPRRQLLVAGRREPLGKRALDIISVLAEARGEIVTKDELLEAVWPGVIVEENALQVHVVALRKALGPEADRLRTIRGVGYQLELDPDPATPASPAVPVHAEPDSQPQPEPATLDPPYAPPPMADVTAPPIRPERGASTVWSWVRSQRIAVAFVVTLALLAGAWAMFGSDLGLRPKERIPVLIRELAPSGSDDQTEAALGGGITDELISRLRRLPELRIATAEPDGSAPSTAFDGAYTVDGTIRSSGDNLRVTVRLSDRVGEILWSETYDRRPSDLFDMQEEIAAAIAGALSVSFDVGSNSVEYGGTDNPEAFAAYMQFFAHQNDFDQTVPRGYLERAVAIDPDFAKAQFGLTVNYTNSMIGAGAEQANALLAKADQASKRALAANAGLWIGHVARGGYELGRRDYLAVEGHMRRAEELDRGDDPQLRTYLANYAMQVGRIRKAAAIRESNQMIDPIHRNDPWRVSDLMMLGRHQESIALYDKLAASGRDDLGGFAYHLFLAYLLAGREAEGMAFVDRQGLPFGDQLSAFRAGRSLQAMSRAELERTMEGLSQIEIGTFALFAGYERQPKLAADLMRLFFDRPGGSVTFYLWHPAMAEARKTDAFERLVTDIGLVELWRKTGDWGDYCKPLVGDEISCT